MDRLHPHLSRCSAYVEFENPEEAQKALKYMDGGRPSTQIPAFVLGSGSSGECCILVLCDSRGSSRVLLFWVSLWFVTLFLKICAHTTDSVLLESLRESMKNCDAMMVLLTSEQLCFTSVHYFCVNGMISFYSSLIFNIL